MSSMAMILNQKFPHFDVAVTRFVAFNFVMLRIYFVLLAFHHYIQILNYFLE
jgi:hypothetical protein